MAEKKHIYKLNKETAELVKDPRRFIIHNSGFLFIFCALISFPVFILLGLFSQYIPHDLYFILSMSLPDLIMLILLFAFIYGYHRMDLMGFKKPEWRSMFFSVPLVLCVYPIMLFSSLLFSFLIPKATYDMSNSTESSLLNMGPIAGYLLLAVLPAVVEEFICRGLIYGAFRQRSAIVAVISSTLCFSLLHGNLDQIVYTAIFSVFLCLMREFTGSIYPCILMHAVLNSISVTTIYFGDVIFNNSSSEIVTEPIILEPTFFNFWMQYYQLFILGMVGIVIAIVLLFFVHKFNHYEHGESDKTLPAISITYIIGWLICIALGIINILF